MATRFAVVSGNWSSGGTWDNGSVPVAGDDVFCNGRTITIDQDINVGSLRSTVPNVYLPDMLIPKMISNSSPSGTVIANNNISTAYYVFDQLGPSTYWGSGAVSGWIGYTFTASTIITRYRWEKDTQGVSWYHPRIWTFEGSNDGFATAGVILDFQSYAANAGPVVFVSSGLTNTTGFTSYRLNVTATSNNYSLSIGTIEMTNNLGTNYGGGGGGSLSVLSGLSGTRNITVTNNQGLISGSATYLININTNSPNIVNINSTGTYMTYILGESTVSYITIAGSGTVNINGNIYRVQKSVNATTATGIINYSGTNTGGFQGSSPTHNLVFAGNATFNVYGFLRGDDIQVGTSGSGTALSYAGNGVCNIYSEMIANLNSAVVLSHSGTLNIFNNIRASATREGINSTASGIINITGQLIPGISAAAITHSGTAPINVLSGVTISANTSSPAIISSSTGLVTAGLDRIINTNTVPAILAQKFRFYSGVTAQWTVQDTTNSNITLSSIGTSGITIGLPLSGDVRYLTTYGQNNEYVGSLRVPSVDNVRKGVQTDFTVGTADLTANDIFSAITVSSNSVAVRLRNVSTVESAGDQIASLS